MRVRYVEFLTSRWQYEKLLLKFEMLTEILVSEN